MVKRMSRVLAAFIVLFGPTAWCSVADGGSPAPAKVPNVYGEGILFAYSGLDGKTLWKSPFVASTTGGEVGLKFHLASEQTLRFRLPGSGLGSLRFRVVANDLLVADVPGADDPLVAVFASADLVVGQVPSGGSVSAEGSGTETVLLQKQDGKRTQFAFAYSAEGAQEAAKVASQGLKASIDTLVEQHLAFFGSTPSAPQDTDALTCRTLAKAFSVMKANVYAPEKLILSRWTTPARWPQPQMSLRESALHSLGLVHLDAGLAKDALAAVYSFQGDDGFLPITMPAQPTEAVSHPPLLAWAAWRVYELDNRRDRKFLEQSYAVIAKQVVWYLKQRRLGGEPPPEKSLEYGTPLYGWKTAAESGQDNSPRFAGGADFAAIDLACYLASECRALQRMAQALRFGEQAKTWDRRAEAIEQAARERLWDPERGFFFDRRGADGPWVDAWTSAAFLTLWSGVATKDQANRLVGHLVSGKFRTAMPVATVARDDPAFKKDMWAGAAWPTMNYLIIRGLQRYGYAKEAADLRQRTLEAVRQWYARTGALWEFYDPDDEAPPAQLDRNGRKTSGIGYAVLGDYNPTAAVFADLVLRPEP